MHQHRDDPIPRPVRFDRNAEHNQPAPRDWLRDELRASHVQRLITEAHRKCSRR